MTARKRHRSEGIRGVDRLSDLPDEVLGHILSFLPTKKAVQTSALSKRWKGLFSLATGLEFHDCFKTMPFINFVDRVLSLHNVSIRKFKLNVWRIDQCDVSCVNAWIVSALSLGAQELDLDLRYEMDDMTQNKLLSSCTMTVLKLKYNSFKYNYYGAILKVPMSVCLSSLRVLNLERIIFPDVNSTSRFFLGCSSLADLTLSSCEWMDGQVYSVSCAKLRNLTIYDPGYLNYTKTPTIELDLPVVVYFKCCSIPQKLFHIKNPDVIHTAEFDIWKSYDKTDVFFIRLMRQLSNVKILRLFGDSLTVLSRIKLSNLPTSFVNLRRLEVGTWDSGVRRGWRHLPKLIARSPLLETLVFKEGLEACYNDLAIFLDDQRKPISKNHITIQVDGYWGRKKEYKLMKLFLRSAAFNLKQLVVNHGSYRRYRTV